MPFADPAILGRQVIGHSALAQARRLKTKTEPYEMAKLRQLHSPLFVRVYMTPNPQACRYRPHLLLVQLYLPTASSS